MGKHCCRITINVPLLHVFLRESDITKERIQKILASGANVILATGGIDDMCLKYFVDVGAMAVRRVLKKDLKRIAKATGGQLTTLKLLPTLKLMFSPSCLEGVLFSLSVF